MNAPPHPAPAAAAQSYNAVAHIADDPAAFVAIDALLRNNGLNAPEIHAADTNNGFVLLEDFGGETILAASGDPDPVRYAAAVDVLVAMRSMPWPAHCEAADGTGWNIPDFSPDVLSVETRLALDWFAPAFAGGPLPDEAAEDFAAIWAALFDLLREDRQVLVIRDYHSPNLMWLADREGTARIGILDFQDALIGHPAYDLVSLAEDARVDMPEALEAELLARYVAGASADPQFAEDRFRAAYAILGAQRNTRLLGTFTRLWKRDGKEAYLRHLPRVSTYLRRNLAHPALAGLADWYRRWMPLALDKDALARMEPAP